MFINIIVVVQIFVSSLFSVEKKVGQNSVEQITYCLSLRWRLHNS